MCAEKMLFFGLGRAGVSNDARAGDGIFIQLNIMGLNIKMFFRRACVLRCVYLTLLITAHMDTKKKNRAPQSSTRIPQYVFVASTILLVGVNVFIYNLNGEEGELSFFFSCPY